MKLIRHGAPGAEKPGLIVDRGLRVDASAFGEDYDEHFFATDGLERLKTWLAKEIGLPPLPDDVRLGPPTCRPSKLICIGLNYADHARESGMTIPDEPVIFFKATSAICGPYDDVTIPKGSAKTDWEVELAAVIGKKASYVTEEEAMMEGMKMLRLFISRWFRVEPAACGRLPTFKEMARLHKMETICFRRLDERNKR